MADDKKRVESKFLNPFGVGVSYVDFLSEVKKSKKTISAYCKNKLTKERIEWLENDIKLIKNK